MSMNNRTARKILKAIQGNPESHRVSSIQRAYNHLPSAIQGGLSSQFYWIAGQIQRQKYINGRPACLAKYTSLEARMNTTNQGA
jgi:hypothetical protein